MNYHPYNTVTKRRRGDDPHISIYLLNDYSPDMEKLSCLWCKRTIADVKGRIDKIVDSPVDSGDYGIAVNIRCKLCHQNYRLVVSSTFTGVRNKLG